MKKIAAQVAAMIATAGLMGAMALPAHALVAAAPGAGSRTEAGLLPQTLAVTPADRVVPARDEYTVTAAADRVDPQAIADRARRVAARHAADASAAQAQSDQRARSARLLRAVAPDPSYSGAAILAYGSQFLGVVPYGTGNSPSTSFSCDGFVQYVFAGFGRSLPRGADRQAVLGVQIDKADAVAGDLVWWPGAHIGIYDGVGGMINSPTTGRFTEHPSTLWGNPEFIRLR